MRNTFVGSRPRSLPRTSPIRDIRRYNGIFDDAANPSNGVGGTPIERVNNFGESAWSRVIRETPGKVHWWRFDRLVDLGTALAVYDCWGIGTILTAPSTGSVSLVPGLVPGDRGKAVLFGGSQFFRMSDYHVSAVGSQNVFSLECWFRLDATPANSALFGQAAGTGHALLVDGTTMMMWNGTNQSVAGVLAVGKVYHVVGVFGGLTKASVLYLNGVPIITSSVGALSGTGLNNNVVPFEMGNYSNNGGGNLVGALDEVVEYSRMLQPDEVRQHYEAAFARVA